MTDSKQSSEDDGFSTEVRTPTGPPTLSLSFSVDHDTNRTARRVVLIAATLAIGFAAFLWGRAVFPTVPAITSIPSYSVSIQEGGSPGALGEEFLNFERQSDGTIKIQSTPKIGFTTTSGNQFLSFSTSLNLLGTHIVVVQCPVGVSCSTMNSPGGRETVLKFRGGSTSQQTQTAVIRDPSFGFAENSEAAVAEMPYVDLVSLPSLQGEKTDQPLSLNNNPFSLSFGYNIPDASAYDWSMPPLRISSNEATWAETVNLITVGGPLAELRGAAQATELTGSDDTVQAIHNQARGHDVVLGFAADHGLAMPGAKCTLYDPGIEVTLLLAGAGVPAGERRSDLVSGVDVGPTLWARAGVDSPSGVDGRDLLGGWTPRERVFAEKTFHSYYDPMRAVRSPVAKLIVNFGVGFRVEVPGDVTEGAIFRSDPGPYTGGPHPVAEFYDLRADPLERHNLLEGDARPTPFEELRTALLAWMRDGDDPVLGARGPLIAPQHRRALHLLGA